MSTSVAGVIGVVGDVGVVDAARVVGDVGVSVVEEKEAMTAGDADAVELFNGTKAGILT